MEVSKSAFSMRTNKSNRVEFGGNRSIPPTTFDKLRITDIRLYPLSVILSFLDECDGTSTLLTHRTWARAILRLFELPPQLVLAESPPSQKQEDDATNVSAIVEKDNGKDALSSHNVRHHNKFMDKVDDKVDAMKSGRSDRSLLRIQKVRHRFIPVPIEDPELLLSRLNTKKLYIRNVLRQRRKEVEANFYSLYGENLPLHAYQRNNTTEELCFCEHRQIGLAERRCRDGEPAKCDDRSRDDTTKNLSIPHYPELLRFKFDSLEQLPHSARNAGTSPTLTLLVSYPRSGNSLLRSLVERITGIVTGSDTRPDRTLSKELAYRHGLVGEGVTNVDRVHLVKSHYPERRGWKTFNVHRMILLTRNPYDAIDSYFNMALTNTHTKTLHDDVYSMYSNVFEDMARSEIDTWKRFHEYWFSFGAAPVDSNRPKLPMLVLRYEDLITKTHEAISRVISFMIGMPLLKAEDSLMKYWQERINHVIGPPSQDNGVPCKANRLGSYKPRIGGIARSLRDGRFDGKLLEELHCIAGDALRTLRYDTVSQQFPKHVRMPRREKVFWNCGPCSVGQGKQQSMREVAFKINAGMELRHLNHPYGRNITAWRKGQTNDDTIPLPTI